MPPSRQFSRGPAQPPVADPWCGGQPSQRGVEWVACLLGAAALIRIISSPSPTGPGLQAGYQPPHLPDEHPRQDADADVRDEGGEHEHGHG